MAMRVSGAPPTTQISFDSATAASVATDALILAVPGGGAAWSGALADVDAAMDGALKQALSDAAFEGAIGKTHVVQTLGRLPAKRIIVTGLPQSGASAEDVRRAYGAALAAAQRAGAPGAATPAPGGGGDETASYRAAVEGALLALYDFKTYKSSADKDKPGLAALTFWPTKPRRPAKASRRATRWQAASTWPATLSSSRATCCIPRRWRSARV